MSLAHLFFSLPWDQLITSFYCFWLQNNKNTILVFMTLKLHIHFTNLIQYSRRLCVVIYKGWPSAHHCKCSYRSPCGKQKSLFDKVILHVWENVKMWDQLLNFNFKVFFHIPVIFERSLKNFEVTKSIELLCVLFCFFSCWKVLLNLFNMDQQLT